MKHVTVSYALRFDIFRRDSFTCQHCRKKAPDVVLQIEIAPSGGYEQPRFLTTCSECESDRIIHQEIDYRPNDSLEADLSLRREQLELLKIWQREIHSPDQTAAKEVAQYWAEICKPFSLNDDGIQQANLLLQKFPVQDIFEAMRVSVKQYLTFQDGAPTSESVNKAWDYVGRICSVRKSETVIPNLRDLLYIRGICKNRFRYCDDKVALELLKEADGLGVNTDYLKRLALAQSCWSDWKYEMQTLIESQQ